MSQANADDAAVVDEVEEVEVEETETADDAPESAAADEGDQPQESHRRRIGPGKPLNVEEVKGSYDHILNRIYHAFYSEFNWKAGLFEVFADYVIVSHDDLNPGEYYLVPYTMTPGEVIFADQEQWEVVELTYQPVSSVTEESLKHPAANESRSRGKGQRITEQGREAHLVIEAAAATGTPRRITARLAQADVINENGRRYRKSVLKEAVAEAQRHLHESLSQGRAFLLGENAHPNDKGQTPQFLETIVVWKDIQFDERTGWVLGAGEIVETDLGRDAIKLMEAGVLPAVSLRGYGEMSLKKDKDGEFYEVEWLRFTGFDLVMEPGFKGAAIETFESRQFKELQTQQTQQEQRQEEIEMPPLTLEELREKYPNLVKQIEESAQPDKAALLRDALGLEEGADPMKVIADRDRRLEELETRERRAAVAKHVAERMSEVKFTGTVLESFQAYMAKVEYDTVEEANTRFEDGLEIFGKMSAEKQLKDKGFVEGQRIESVAPTTETRYDAPGFARASLEISESMRRSGRWMPRASSPETLRAELFRDAYLARFDKMYERELQKESEQWAEAMTSAALDLPYSVLRAVVDEAFPQLIAPNVFDFGVVDMNPVRISYEAQFVAETGLEVTVTDEEFTSAHDAWVNLDGHYINFGSVVVTNSDGSTTYVEGSDYLIDPLDGKIMALSTGDMADTTAHKIDYTYSAIRKGENVAIERAKSGLAHTTLTLAADRLATQITSETIKFSQSQLGYDAVQRTINLLVKEILKKRDGALLYMAISKAMSVANNNAGTWVSASDPISKLIELIGTARVKVGNRNYTPGAVIMSLTNVDRLSNSDQFSAAGSRPDAAIDAQGYAGRIKGLPVYYSTLFTDNRVLVLDPGFLSFRTMGDMTLEGPYQSYDTSTGELIASKQWFVEEYTGVVCPLPEKASYLVVT